MINYKWDLNGDESQVAQALKVAKQDGLNLKTVYFGIECWAQGAGGSPVTYGIDSIGGQEESGSFGNGVGHGGTATGLAVKPLAERGLGSAIFSAHWAYPHFSRAGHEGGGDMYSRAVDRFMWEGKPDLEGLEGLQCDCNGGISTHIRADLGTNPITKYAERYPAGSEGFFHSDYKEPVSYVGPKQFRAHIGQQSILPAPAERFTTLSNVSNGNVVGTISANLLEDPLSGTLKGLSSRCSINVEIKAATSIGEGSQLVANLPLHLLNARGKLDLDLIVTYQRLVEFPEITMSIFAEYGGAIKPLSLSEKARKRKTQTFQIRNTQDHITAIGISIQGPSQAFTTFASAGITALLNIFEITLKPSKESYPVTEIREIRLVQRGHSETNTAHYRLAWSIPNTTPTSTHLPWSPLTGPFSHFTIAAGGTGLGRAYATEFIIDQSVYEGWAQKGRTSASFEVFGYAFDGTRIGYSSTTLFLLT